MGFLDTFKGNQYKNSMEALQKEYDSLKKQYNDLQKEHDSLKALMTPEIIEALDIKQEILELQKQQKSEERELSKLKKIFSAKNIEINSLDKTIQKKKETIVWMDDEILVQEFGLYQPKFDFASALDYKEKLAEIRATQKGLIKNNLAVSDSTNWQVNGSLSKGKKMVSETEKLLLRAFNSECDELVSKVKYTNFDASVDRIYKSAATISKLGSTMDISITQQYLSAKVKEIRLAFEYQLKKQQEKEAEKAARAEQREQAKLQKELEEQRKKFEKEQTHYQTAYKKLITQIEQNPDNLDLLAKRSEMEQHLSDIEKSLQDVDYRQANMKAGYVYIISNIGSFGENVYKIGMTRRLDPQDRIDELGDASVPFNFDVHAMIFSDDAPALEAALHRAFEKKKLNMVNHRREFFHVTLDEIKAVIKQNFDKTIEFIDVPDAEQYRISQKMKTEN